MKHQYDSMITNTANFLCDVQLYDRTLWAKFVNQFRVREDSDDHGWRGEYWGKSLRGAVLVYEATADEKLYAIITETVRDMLTVAEPNGRVSSYREENEFCGWDVWCRKYVMLALEYYYDICKDEQLKVQVTAFIKGCADYMMTKIGGEDGKMTITESSGWWKGLNASSVLEAIVRLYNITKEKKYFDFATHIIEQGGCKGINILELAYENKLYPYQYGVPKAYEMMSFFEGVYEYYLITGIEKYRIALERFAKAVIASDITILGCAGIVHELFDCSRYRQTVYYEGISQETCVSVTWMKFCARMLALTGDSIYADCMEQTYYNAYLGALNTDRCIGGVDKYQKRYNLVPSLLPFDSYSPLIAQRRGRKTGGFKKFADDTYYGCCACIGAAGLGIFLNTGITPCEGGFAFQQYTAGSADAVHKGTPVHFEIDTKYPADGTVAITVSPTRPLELTLKLRLPQWCNGKYQLNFRGESRVESGYLVLRKEFVPGETFSITFEMPLVAHKPLSWDSTYIFITEDYKVMVKQDEFHKEEEDHYVAFTRGPLVMAVDSRMGKPAESTFCFSCSEGDTRDYVLNDTHYDGIDAMVNITVCDDKCEEVHLCDYQAAGKDWKTNIAAWLKTE